MFTNPIKNRRIMKKALCLFFAFLLSIESLAAVVSDNDGSAFITKAEFDSLKNNFQSQLDSFNTNIDSKIDTAIASYLAGINIAKTSTKNVIVGLWKEYTLMNGTIANEFAYPDFSGNTTWLANNVNDSFRKIWFAFGELKYKRTGKSNKRVLVDNVTPASTLDLSNITWVGVATNAREAWTVTKIYRNDNLSAYGGVGASDRYMWAFSPMNLSINGYVSDLNASSQNNLWRLQWAYEARGSYWGYATYPSPAFANAVTISYEDDASNNSIIYSHLGSYKWDTPWECSIKDCVNYFATSSNNTKRTDGWVSLTTKTGDWSAMDAPRAGGSEDWQENRSILWDDRKLPGSGSGPQTNKATIPTVGLINSNLKANNIYQYQDLFDNDSKRMNRLTMEQGIPIMKVGEGEKIEWEPIWIDVKVNGVADTVELVPVFSYAPFTTETSVADTNDYVKIDGYEKGYFPYTINHKVKIKFTAEKDGYIYLKWYPAIGTFDQIANTPWEATIDLENCPTYKVTEKD